MSQSSSIPELLDSPERCERPLAPAMGPRPLPRVLREALLLAVQPTSRRDGARPAAGLAGGCASAPAKSSEPEEADIGGGSGLWWRAAPGGAGGSRPVLTGAPWLRAGPSESGPEAADLELGEPGGEGLRTLGREASEARAAREASPPDIPLTRARPAEPRACAWVLLLSRCCLAEAPLTSKAPRAAGSFSVAEDSCIK
mmetsp:Transcript_37370/g.106759  ORF Transcript_37370/g.106759 Transcript_37370/m.106759 type:complete len:199 (+) Transcript_37370:320-916(+)